MRGAASAIVFLWFFVPVAMLGGLMIVRPKNENVVMVWLRLLGALELLLTIVLLTLVIASSFSPAARERDDRACGIIECTYD